MRIGIFPFGLLFAALLVFSGCSGKPPALSTGNYSNALSEEAEDLVRKGVSCHDRGDYQGAIDYYNQAMELAPDHPVIYYEMGFSRMAMGEKATALELAEKGINSAIIREYDEMVPTLLDLKGSALYNLGRYEEAAAVYLLAINEYHVTSVFPFYNLGLNYYRLERDEEAADALRRALLINPNHASSNYLLGKICVEHGEKTQAFYAFCYFLLMEPNTERAVQAYNSLKDLLSMQEEILGISDNGTFTAKLEYMFTALEEQRNSGKISRSAGDELWWEFYSPFFYRIVKSEYAAVFYRYIGISADPDADSWLQTNQNEIGDFFVWLNDYFE